MKQVSLKLKIYAVNARNISVVNNGIEKNILRIMLWSLALLALLYVLFLGNMVRNIIERRSLEGQARALSSEVGAMELTYLSLMNNIDLNLSHSLGFKETKTTFAKHKSFSLLSGEEPFDSVKIAQNDI